MINLIDEVLKLPIAQKKEAYFALQENLRASDIIDDDNFSESDMAEMEKRLEEMETGKVKGISLKEHLHFINSYGIKS